ncbi:MAG: phosphopantothenoylcysteine decarboxylase [bacterium]
MNRSILITAGPTWVPIDEIRIITNISTGETGYNIAKKALEIGYNVTLLMGPGSVELDKTYFGPIELIRFNYYTELLSHMKILLLSRKYHIIIHSSAVSDYMIKETIPGKIRSGLPNLQLTLEPTIKIVDKIKEWAKDIILVKFKLECHRAESDIIDIAYQSLVNSKADIVVANRYGANGNSIDYTCIIDKKKNITKVQFRSQLPEILLNKLESLCSPQTGIK